jgi:hypothetical protein
MFQINKTFAVLAAGAALAVAGSAAQAATYANGANGSVYSFGAPDTTSYGQVFTAPGGSLQSWSFYTSDSNTSNAKLVIANWDGGKAVGPALYEGLLNSASLAPSGYYEHLYSGINLALANGTSYIAYLTVAGVANPASSVTFSASDTSPLDGGFRFLNSGGTDPLSLNVDWSSWYNPHVQYTAVFGEGAVPEPASWAMMIGGFAIAGAAMRRRSAKLAFA